MLAMEQVTRAFGTHVALDRVSLQVERAEMVFLVGPSGSGKTTALRLFNGELKPQHGTVRAVGVEVSNMSRRQLLALRRRVAIIPQDCRLVEMRSIGWNVEFPLAAVGWSRRRRRDQVMRALDQVGLSGYASRFPRELSGGERQRAVIARAIAINPDVLLADEPTGQVDPGTALEIAHVLDGLVAYGCTVVMATHDEPLVDQMRCRVVRLEAGRVVSSVRGGRYRGDD